MQNIPGILGIALVAMVPSFVGARRLVSITDKGPGRLFIGLTLTVVIAWVAVLTILRYVARHPTETWGRKVGHPTWIEIASVSLSYGAVLAVAALVLFCCSPQLETKTEQPERIHEEKPLPSAKGEDDAN